MDGARATVQVPILAACGRPPLAFISLSCYISLPPSIPLAFALALSFILKAEGLL